MLPRNLATDYLCFGNASYTLDLESDGIYEAMGLVRNSFHRFLGDTDDDASIIYAISRSVQMLYHNYKLLFLFDVILGVQKKLCSCGVKRNRCLLLHYHSLASYQHQVHMSGRF